MLSIPIPAGLEVPEEGQFEAPVTFESANGELIVLAIGGVPVSDEVEESEEEEMPEESGAPNEDFMSAVERQMGAPR